MYSTVRSSPASRSQGALPASPAPTGRRASELTIASQFEYSNVRTFSTDLIYLQTLILMGLESENHGPAKFGGVAGPPRATWLGAAVGQVYTLKLHSNRVSKEKLVQGDPDSDEKLGRRAWWILVILDRWHAISTSSLLFIPDSSVALLVEDQTVLGAETYQITRELDFIGYCRLYCIIDAICIRGSFVLIQL